MVSFNKITGALLIDDILFRPHQHFEELEAMLKGKGCKVHLGVNNPPWETYVFMDIKDSLNTFNGSISFNEKLLMLVAISLETGDKSWDEFIVNIENTKVNTLDFVNELIGSERYIGSWGSAGYFFDEKGMNVTFCISYK